MRYGLFLMLFVSSQICVATSLYAEGIAITNLRMVFDNGKSVLSVEPGGMVQAYAIIKYRGTGVLEGQWRVNDRLLSRVQKQLNGSRSYTVSTPRVPPLPTEQMGSYRLEFIVTVPAGSHRQQLLIYHVMGKP